MKNEPKVWRADWPTEQDTICAIRRRVFIEEQQVPEDLEWDGLDRTAIHVLGSVNPGPACATARLLPDGRIGRMAVLPAYRNRGLGSALLAELMATAAEAGMQQLCLHAQMRVLAFYQRFGFEASGDTFVEAGIRHCLMRWQQT